MSSTNHREKLLSVMRGETVDRIPWVPRIDLWHNAQVFKGTLPERFEGMAVDDVHRALGWPLHKFVPEFSRPERPEDGIHRGIGLYDLKEYPCTFELPSDVDVQVTPAGGEGDDMMRVDYDTPVGQVSVVHGFTAEMKKAGASISWVKEHAIKGPEDYEVLAHIFGNLTIKPAYERFDRWRESVGDDGIAVAQGLGLICGSPMHFIQKSFLGATEFYIHHHDYPNQIAQLLEALGDVYDQALEVLSGATMDAILWVANVDDMITYPALYAKYIQPWCRKAADILKPNGVVMICHPDGENQGLMELLTDSGMDVADAVTPYPMTKLRLGEYYERWCRPGHLTIHGGIPEVLLLEESSTRQDLEDFMDDLFKNIAPGNRFIASIGDTTPPGADFDRLLYIGERIEREGKLPLAGSGSRTRSTIAKKRDRQAITVESASKSTGEPITDTGLESAFGQITTDVLEGEEQDILVHAVEMLDQGYSAEDILNIGMLPAMDVIGARFTDGTVFLPEVLLSARAMNNGLKLLEPDLARANVKGHGRVLIGTVLGDLHDIGKNMVISMLKGTGFEVIDMGVNVDTERIVEQVAEHRPDILGLSALLTTTMPQMKEAIDALADVGLREDLKVLVGGAPVNKKFADGIGADGFADDAAEAVVLAKRQVHAGSS